MNSKIFINTLYSYVNQYGCSLCRKSSTVRTPFRKYCGIFKCTPNCYLGEEEKLLDENKKNPRIFRCHNFLHDEYMYFNSKFMWIFDEGVVI